MVNRLEIHTIGKNEELHYIIHDKLTGKTICCNKNELNEAIWNLLGV